MATGRTLGGAVLTSLGTLCVTIPVLSVSLGAFLGDFGIFLLRRTGAFGLARIILLWVFTRSGFLLSRIGVIRRLALAIALAVFRLFFFYHLFKTRHPVAVGRIFSQRLPLVTVLLSVFAARAALFIAGLAALA